MLLGRVDVPAFVESCERSARCLTAPARAFLDSLETARASFWSNHVPNQPCETG
jgi:hypothetical protein